VKSLIPSKRTAIKLGRDALVIGIPALAVWVIGHPANLADAGLSGEEVVKLTSYASGLLMLYRIWRQFRGTEPTA